MDLIVTCARHLEPETKEELERIFDELGDSEIEVNISEMSGILTLKTSLNAIEAVTEIKKRVIDEPWSVRYCLRFIPIQKFCEANIDEIEKTVLELSRNISDSDTYRISIEKRNSDVSSKEIITKIASKFTNKVSLEFPDKIISIQILGKNAGISIIRKTDILSIEKTKRSLSD